MGMVTPSKMAALVTKVLRFCQMVAEDDPSLSQSTFTAKSMTYLILLFSLLVCD